MNCPLCKEVELRISERQGIEIDYCPQCRGVWLDRGELDKLIERSLQVNAMPSQPLPPQQMTPQQPAPRYEQPRYRDDDDDDYKHRKRHKKGGWLGDLLDFD